VLQGTGWLHTHSSSKCSQRHKASTLSSMMLWGKPEQQLQQRWMQHSGDCQRCKHCSDSFHVVLEV
jgi:hypothetical protein